MLSWLSRSLALMVFALAQLSRVPPFSHVYVFAALGSRPVQPLLLWLGRVQAFYLYRRAQRLCPAYAAFLKEQGFTGIDRPRDFPRLPITNKQNYVKQYSVEERCTGGRLPRRGVIIDESSGSSGEPTNWARGAEEQETLKQLIQHGFRLNFGSKPMFVMNCFALGPWATGMNVSFALRDIAILKSLGPDARKIEATLRTFGDSYRYLLTGYPPFIKDFVDNTELDLKSYHLELVVGGEGMSEALRDHLLRVFRRVVSSYGASDLEINLGAESEYTLWLRRLALKDTALCQALFGRPDAPMLFQYNPFDYLVETSPANELVITVLRRSSVAPKLRYNILDVGGALSVAEVDRALQAAGHSGFSGPRLHFPLMFVYGRSDLTVAFYGANLFIADLDRALHEDELLRQQIHSFSMRVEQDESLNQRLHLSLERKAAPASAANHGELATDTLAPRFYEALRRINQDFAEVSKMFGPERIVVELHDYQQGPFAGRDIRIKHRYLA